MTREQLDRILRGFQVNPMSYDLSGEVSDDALCLLQESDGWHVFYSERGLRTGEHVYPTETEACEALLELIASEPTTRWFPADDR